MTDTSKAEEYLDKVTLTLDEIRDLACLPWPTGHDFGYKYVKREDIDRLLTDFAEQEINQLELDKRSIKNAAEKEVKELRGLLIEWSSTDFDEVDSEYIEDLLKRTKTLKP